MSADERAGAQPVRQTPTEAMTGPEPHRTGRESDVVHTEHEPMVDVSVGDKRRDPVRWSAVWAGLIVTLATFILVELLFFSLGWLTTAQGDPGTTADWVSGLIGLFAFFMGGLIAGGTSIWRGAREGVVHGALVWALGVVGIILLTVLGGGALLGSLASAFTQVASLQQANLPDAQLAQAVDTARDAAGWAVLGLVLSLMAAVAGGAGGVKMGSKRRKGRTS